MESTIRRRLIFIVGDAVIVPIIKIRKHVQAVVTEHLLDYEPTLGRNQISSVIQ